MPLLYIWLGLGSAFICIISFLTGISVYYQNTANRVNQSFIIFCVTSCIWAGMYFFPWVQHSYELSKLSFIGLHIGAIFSTTTHMHFITALLGVFDNYKVFIKRSYIAHIMLLPFVFTTYFIKDVVPKFDFKYWADPNFLYHIWLIGFFGIVIYTFYIIYTQYKRAEKQDALKYYYIAIGELLTFGFGSTNFFLFYDINIPPVLNIIACGQIVLFGYVVGAYRFHNLEVAFLRILKNIIALIISLSTGVLLFYILDKYKLLPFNNLYVFEYILLISTILISLIVFLMIRKYIPFGAIFHLNTFENYVKKLYNFRDNHNFYTDINTLNNDLEILFVHQLFFEKCKIYSMIQDKNENHELFKILRYYKKTILINEIKDKITSSEYQLLQKYGTCFCPLTKGDTLIGIFIIGDKSHSSSYTKEELDILDIFSQHISIIINVIHYNYELALEVKEQTQKLSEQAQTLLIANKKLKDLDSAKDAFLSVASHELRTPMTIIKGYSDFLLSNKFGSLEEQQKNFIRKIQESTNNLIELVNNILDTSKIEAGRIEFHYKDTNFITLITQIIEQFHFAAGQKYINFKSVISPNIPQTIYTDPEKVRLILNNIIGNALKFTPENGSITLRAYISEDNKYLVFEVEDTGVGIAPDDIPHIFERFKQVDNYLQQNQKGTGLGLNIVKKVIHEMNGDIFVKSILGKGTCFILKICYNSISNNI